MKPLVCPACRGELLEAQSVIACSRCKRVYPVADGIIDFAPGEHYDRFAPGDALTPEHLHGLELEIEGSRRRIEDFYLPLIREAGGSRVLDSGCGNGVSVETLVRHGLDAWGNDLSELRAWQWRQREVRDRLVVASALRLPFPEDYFDVVISSGVIEHIGVVESAVAGYSVRALPDRDEQRLAFLAELGRVLRPGGALYIDCPNGAFPIDFWHNDAAGKPRFHSVREPFLPRYGEIRRAARQALPGSRVRPVSPLGRLQFRQAGRHLYGRLLAPAGTLLFRMMTWRPFGWLAGTPLNPFLVVEIRKPPFC